MKGSLLGYKLFENLNLSCTGTAPEHEVLQSNSPATLKSLHRFLDMFKTHLHYSFMYNCPSLVFYSQLILRTSPTRGLLDPSAIGSTLKTRLYVWTSVSHVDPLAKPQKIRRRILGWNEKDFTSQNYQLWMTVIRLTLVGRQSQDSILLQSIGHYK